MPASSAAAAISAANSSPASEKTELIVIFVIGLRHTEHFAPAAAREHDDVPQRACPQLIKRAHDSAESRLKTVKKSIVAHLTAEREVNDSPAAWETEQQCQTVLLLFQETPLSVSGWTTMTMRTANSTSKLVEKIESQRRSHGQSRTAGEDNV